MLIVPLFRSSCVFKVIYSSFVSRTLVKCSPCTCARAVDMRWIDRHCFSVFARLQCKALVLYTCATQWVSLQKKIWGWVREQFSGIKWMPRERANPTEKVTCGMYLGCADTQVHWP